VLSEFSAFCQQTVIIDTTDYLPYYYDGALDNNLMVAASRGYDQQIEKLISKGADINAETQDGATPLIFAVVNNQDETVRKLLGYDPDVNKITAADETPLLISVKNNNPVIAELLIRAGADIDMSDSRGASPIHYAAVNGYLQLVDLLIYYGADCNKKTVDGTSPLMASIWAGYPDVSDLLIQNGANLEARDKDGFTPLLIAAQNGDTLIMDILIKQGVDLYEKTVYNTNALTIAIESNHREAFEYLLRKGDKWTSDDKGGINPYKTASSFGRKDMIRYLESKDIQGRMGFHIDEISVTPSIIFNKRDFYTGAIIMFREPVLRSGLMTGFDFKPVFTRVLVKAAENTYYQYYDRSSIIYGGIFKDLTINESRTGIVFSGTTSLSAGYSFGPEYRGTNIPAPGKVRIMPSAGLKLQYKHFSAIFSLSYMKTQFNGISPLWIRFGTSYNYFLSRIRSPRKTIKWR
jgi:ankyrin repeat protein